MTRKFYSLLAVVLAFAMLIGAGDSASASAVESSMKTKTKELCATSGAVMSIRAATRSNGGSFDRCIKPVRTNPLPPKRTPSSCDQNGSMSVLVQTDPNVKGVKVDGTLRVLPYTTSTPGAHVVSYVYTKVAEVAHDPSGIYLVEAQLACGDKVEPTCIKGSAKVVTNCKALHNAARVVVRSDSGSNTMVPCKVTFRRNGQQVREPFTSCSVEPGQSFTKTFKHLKRGTKVTVRVAGKAWSAIVQAKCSPSMPPPTGQKGITGKV